MDATVIDTASSVSPYALFSVAKIVYGISSNHVLSIEILKESTPLVNSPSYTLGIVDFRGDMIPLIGLRQLFGKPPRGDGIRTAMSGFSGEHEAWMQELEDAVLSGRDPELDFDPESDGLIAWLQEFGAQNNNLSVYLNQINQAHTSMYSSGKSIAGTAKTDRAKAADELKELRAGHAKETIALLDSFMEEVYLKSIREMLIVLNVDGMTKGIVVDDIVAVEYINKFVELPEHSDKSKYIRSLARRDKDNSTVLLIDEELIIQL